MNSKKTPKPDHKSKNTDAAHPTGRKATAKEVQERVRLAAQLRARCLKKHEIIQVLCEKYGVTWQMAQIYFCRATDQAMQALNEPRQNHICRSVEVYERIVADPQSKKNEVISARARIDSLLGLDAPRRTELSGPGGTPIATEDKTPMPDPPVELLERTLHYLESERVKLIGEHKQSEQVGNGEAKGNGQ